MRIAAYVLAADPTWVRTSVRAYYPHVSRIVVSYDRRGRGWSGEPVASRRVVAALRSIDRDRKLRLVPGDFAGREDDDLMAAETAQRRAALAVAGVDADWVLQVDTDEVLPDAGALRCALAGVPAAYQAVSWPMRVLYRRLRDGRYLEVAAPDGGLHVEYPGPVAIRAGATLHHARYPVGPVLRVPVATPEQVIWHNSWARSPRTVRRKVLSWGHGGPEMLEYYSRVWLPATGDWQRLRDLHPLDGPRWHHLRPAPPRPFPLARWDRPR